MISKTGHTTVNGYGLCLSWLLSMRKADIETQSIPPRKKEFPIQLSSFDRDLHAHGLGDAVAAADREGLFAEIGQNQSLFQRARVRRLKTLSFQSATRGSSISPYSPSSPIPSSAVTPRPGHPTLEEQYRASPE